MDSRWLKPGLSVVLCVHARSLNGINVLTGKVNGIRRGSRRSLDTIIVKLDVTGSIVAARSSAVYFRRCDHCGLEMRYATFDMLGDGSTVFCTRCYQTGLHAKRGSKPTEM
jgi:hypothetical protein